MAATGALQVLVLLAALGSWRAAADPAPEAEALIDLRLVALFSGGSVTTASSGPNATTAASAATSAATGATSSTPAAAQRPANLTGRRNVQADLGLDERLGRQVLRLAIARARQLQPRLGKLEVEVVAGTGSCGDPLAASLLAARLAELVYTTGSNSSSRARRSVPVDALLGPSCASQVDAVARMAAYWRTPVYSVASIEAQFSRKDVYSTLTRLSPSTDQLSAFAWRVLAKFGWKHVAVLLDRGQPEQAILWANLERTFGLMRYVHPIEARLLDVDSSQLAPPPAAAPAAAGSRSAPEAGACSEHARHRLLEANKNARVFLLLTGEPRALLVCGHELGMNNGEYAFLTFNIGIKSTKGSPLEPALESTTSGAEPDSSSSSSSSSSTSYSEASRSSAAQRRSTNLDWYSAGDESNNGRARQMFESLLVFSAELPSSAEFELFVEQTLELAHLHYPRARFERTALGPVAVALHDALLVAVDALVRRRERVDRRLAANATSASGSGSIQAQFAAQELEASSASDSDTESEDPTGSTASSVERLASALASMEAPALPWGERYAHGLMSSVAIGTSGDQELAYVLSDLEPELGILRPVASYLHESRELVWLPGSYVHWPGKQKGSRGAGSDSDSAAPPDEPECGFGGDAERCVDRDNLYAALAVTAVLLALVAAGGAGAIRRYRDIRYQMQLDDLWWMLDWAELQFVQASDSLVSSAQGVARALRAGGGSLVSGEAGAGARSVAGASDCGGSYISVSRPLRRRKSLSKPANTGPLPVIVTGADGEVAPAAKPASSAASATGNRYTSYRNQPSAGGPGSERRSGARSNTLMAGGSAVQVRSDLSWCTRSARLAVYRNELVIVKQVEARELRMSRELLVELKAVRELVNDNLARFVGLSVQPGQQALAYEFCSRGSLQDLLLNDSVTVDATLAYSMLGDIVNGLNFIHTTELGHHGRLKSTNLVLDSRFTVKITDFGLPSLYGQLEMRPCGTSGAGGRPADDDDDLDDEDAAGAGADSEGQPEGGAEQGGVCRPADLQSVALGGRAPSELHCGAQSVYQMDSVSVRGPASLCAPGGRGQRSRRAPNSPGAANRTQLTNRPMARLFWCAPEHLREPEPRRAGSKRGDVYALGVIMCELLTRRQPYHFGTTARPHWATVRAERPADTSGPGGAGAGGHRKLSSHSGALAVGGARNSIVSNMSKGGAQRSGRRLRGPRNSVAPLEEQSGSEATSQVSHSSRMPGEHRKSSVAPGSQQQADKGPPVDADEVLEQVRMGVLPDPVRPYLPNFVLERAEPRLVDLMRLCWAEAPQARPQVAAVRVQLRKITKGLTARNYLDNLLERLQSYAGQLESIVEARGADLLVEQRRTDELLYQLVPKFVADRLKSQQPIEPREFHGVTIFFSDIVGFEKFAAVMSPAEQIDLLNSVYSSFDSIISSFDVTKIETIIDQYLVAAGISMQDEQPLEAAAGAPAAPEAGPAEAPDPGVGPKRGVKGPKRLVEALSRRTDSMAESGPAATGAQAVATMDLAHYARSSAEQIARMALCIRDLAKSFHFRQSLARNTSSSNNNNNNIAAAAGEPEAKAEPSGAASLVAASFNIRIGVHSGRVCAGIVGLKRPKYCLIGDTVNVASRMHTNSKANKIQVSADSKRLLELVPGLLLEPRGRIEVKGKGSMETFWLESSY